MNYCAFCNFLGRGLVLMVVSIQNLGIVLNYFVLLVGCWDERSILVLIFYQTVIYLVVF